MSVFLPKKRASIGVIKKPSRARSHSSIDENTKPREVKVEEPSESDDESASDFQFAVPSLPVKKRPAKRRLTMDSIPESRESSREPLSRRSMSVSNSDTSSTVSIDRSTPTRSSSVRSSRASSVASSRAGSVVSFGDPDVMDGKIKGVPMERRERDLLEYNSCIHYPFPRFTNFTDGKRKPRMKGLVLELILQGERSDGASVEDQSYNIDAILAIDKNAVLLAWEGYKFPTWQDKVMYCRGTAYVEYNRRQKMLTHVMKRLLDTETLESMRRNYPNISINQTLDYGEYVKHPGIVYMSGLRKREGQINDYLDHHYGRDTDDVGPTLIFEDWTNFERSSIPAFEYIVDSELTDETREVENELMSVKAICNCTKICDINQGCACAKKASSNIAYVKKLMLGNTVKVYGDGPKGHKEISPDSVDAYECGESCGCDPTLCLQRVMQRGRRHRLIVFRHYDKGWTLRAAHKIEKGTFVCEYTGVMSTLKEASNKGDQTYQVEIEVKTQNNRSRSLVLDARLKGNEGRFVSHSCEPNLFSFRVHYDIKGRPKRHIGMYASRDINPGEELTFDYYPNFQDPEKFSEKVQFNCKCGSSKCRSKAAKKAQAKDDDESEE